MKRYGPKGKDEPRSVKRDLQSFIEELEARGELKRVEASVSAELEITQITDRVSKAHGPALLFTHVQGSRYPVLMNAMGSYERMSRGLGAQKLDEIGDAIARYLDLGNYFSIKKLVRSIPRLLRLLYALPIRSPLRGACQQVIERDVDLSTLPVLKCWPQDAGPFITLPLVFTKDLDSSLQNVGMYRLQILDRTSTGMHWHKHKDGSQMYRRYRDSGRVMPVSVALGCDPAITYAATAPLPAMIDEMMLAGWLRRSNVRMVKCVTNDIYVPANAEFVLEGYVDPKEDLVLEGPFGDHTGYYSLADFYPRFHVTCITRKRNPVYPATVVGKPPMEDCYMAKATERIFLPFLRLQIPELADVNFPLEGVFHNCVLVSIRNGYPGCARKVMNALWGMGQMMYTKLIVVVDDRVDVQNLSQVRDAVLARVTPECLVLSEGPLDALDHSSARALYGTRLGVDATAEPGDRRGDVFDTYRIIAVRKQSPAQGLEALREYMEGHSDRFAIAVDEGVDPQDLSTVMWKVFNNMDASRDIVTLNGKIGIDATKKTRAEGLTRDWPDDIVMTEEIVRRVAQRWSEYGID